MMQRGSDGAPFFCLAAAFRRLPKGRHRVIAIYHDYLRLVPDSPPAHSLTPKHWRNCVRGVAQNPKGLIRNYARLTPPVTKVGGKSGYFLDCCPFEACSWHQSVSGESMRRHRSCDQSINDCCLLEDFQNNASKLRSRSGGGRRGVGWGGGTKSLLTFAALLPIESSQSVCLRVEVHFSVSPNHRCAIEP